MKKVILEDAVSQVEDMQDTMPDHLKLDWQKCLVVIFKLKLEYGLAFLRVLRWFAKVIRERAEAPEASEAKRGG